MLRFVHGNRFGISFCWFVLMIRKTDMCTYVNIKSLWQNVALSGRFGVSVLIIALM